MNRLNYSDLLLLKHTVNTCLYFGKTYHIQSRDTQRAFILKRYGVAIPIATFDRAIKRVKAGWGLLKQHRTRRVQGAGHKWTSAITGISWMLVMLMWRLGELTREQFEALKRILGLVKKRGPAKLRATPAAQQVRKERLGDEPPPSHT